MPARTRWSKPEEEAHQEKSARYLDATRDAWKMALDLPPAPGPGRGRLRL